MNDQEMRRHIDERLAQLERRQRRLKRGAGALAAAGLALALEGCVYAVDMYGVPDYGVPIEDAGELGDAGSED
jgi:hypothetical protein